MNNQINQGIVDIVSSQVEISKIRKAILSIITDLKTLPKLNYSRHRLAVKIAETAKVIEKGNPRILQLPVTQELSNTENKLSKYIVGKPNFHNPLEKTLMLVGATGAGKTTLVNGMINYILGVEWQDAFRFKLTHEEIKVSQAHSQTKWISAYKINSMEGSPIDYNLTIIDTPGFGDTEGMKRDQMIIEQVREFFSIKEGINKMDGVIIYFWERYCR